MKRTIPVLLLVILMLMLLLGACSSGAKEASTSPNAKKALFVGGGNGDPFLIQRLKTLGFEVNAKADSEVTAEDAKNAGLIYISYTAKATQIGTKLAAATAPIIYSNAKAAVVHNLLKSEDQAGTFVHENGLKSIDIVDKKHPIADGFSGNVEVFSKIGNSSFATPTIKATIVASAPGEPGKGTIIAFEKGTADTNGKPLPARQVFYYVFHDSETKINENGWKLFDAMVKWAAS
ncbi:hypothetical protein [Paenibacillus sp. y28]|uniref:hypothetical protein n=1 Tax=Paenibacillus sp. y28 TaxID=3129110 RepID=UPI00301AFF74